MRASRTYWTVIEAAALLGVSKRTVQGWCLSETIEAYRGPNGNYRIPRDAIGRSFRVETSAIDPTDPMFALFADRSCESPLTELEKLRVQTTEQAA